MVVAPVVSVAGSGRGDSDPAQGSIAFVAGGEYVVSGVVQGMADGVEILLSSVSSGAKLSVKLSGKAVNTIGLSVGTTVQVVSETTGTLLVASGKVVAFILNALGQIKYNMAAYPFSTKYQNSNQWVLEVLASAEASDVKVRTREQGQAWLKMAGYQPTEMRIGPMTRLGGRMFKANIAFDDHPSALRFSDRINVVTVESIMAFVRARDEGWGIEEIKGRR